MKRNRGCAWCASANIVSRNPVCVRCAVSGQEYSEKEAVEMHDCLHFAPMSVREYRGDVLPLLLWVCTYDVWDKSSEEYEPVGNRSFPERSDAYAVTSVVSLNGVQGTVVIFRPDKTHDTKVYAHEAVHCAYAWCCRLGIDDEETMAYMVQWFYQKIKECFDEEY